MLVESLQIASCLIEEKRGIGQEVEDKKKLQRQLNLVRTNLDQAISVVVQAALFRQHRPGFELPLEVSDFQQLCIILDEIEQQCGAGTVDAALLQEVSSWVMRISTNLRTAWQSNVEDETAELAKSLKEFAPLLPNEAVALGLSRDLKKHQTQWPPTPMEFASLTKQIKAAKDLLGAFSGDDEVREFLLRVAANTARVQHLNTHIINWLRKHHFEGKLSVSFQKEEN